MQFHPSYFLSQLCYFSLKLPLHGIGKYIYAVVLNNLWILRPNHVEGCFPLSSKKAILAALKKNRIG
jgi:hypothetical protein